MSPAKATTLTSYPFTDILGWSVSRYDTFQSCRRKYYYDYYNKYDTEFPRAKIIQLKSMTTLALEAGNIVHDAIKTLLERLLKTEDPIDTTRFMAYARRKAADYTAAKTFAEVYYRETPAMEPQTVFALVEQCLTAFLQSPRFAWITEKAVRNKTGWIIEPGGFGETRIDGLKAYCKVDFLFPVDGRIHILDWKTGKPAVQKHRKQMVGYAAWASQQCGAALENIEPTVAYLRPPYAESTIAVNEFDAQEFSSAVAAETAEMHALCATVERNVPRPKESFPQTARTGLCKYCNYRELCGRAAVTEG